MDRVLFGDNQFFGVNHMSEEKARAQSIKFQKLDAILEVLDQAYAEGIRVFMCTTHERVGDICDHVRANPHRYPELRFYPCMPYAHKYANAVTERGILDALRLLLPAEGAIGALLQSGVSLASRDVDGLARMLIAAEMKMFRGLSTPVIFLQNVVTDLLLGLGIDEAFRLFADIIEKEYAAEAGFITMNAPMLLGVLRRNGFKNPIVCTTINSRGFRMPGGQQAYVDAFNTEPCRIVAMSVLASGAVRADEAIHFLKGLPSVEAVVFGASSRANIEQTKRLLDRLFLAATDTDPSDRPAATMIA
jgi:hypothetical protein